MARTNNPSKLAGLFRRANTLVHPLLRSPLHGVLSSRLCFALDATDRPSHAEQASMIRRYIIWWNRNAHDKALRELVKCANVARHSTSRRIVIEIECKTTRHGAGDAFAPLLVRSRLLATARGITPGSSQTADR